MVIGYSIFRLQKISRITSIVDDRPLRFRNLSTKKGERMTTCMEAVLPISQEEVMMEVFLLETFFMDAESVV